MFCENFPRKSSENYLGWLLRGNVAKDVNRGKENEMERKGRKHPAIVPAHRNFMDFEPRGRRCTFGSCNGASLRAFQASQTEELGVQSRVDSCVKMA
jgi:hypothetical protein